MTAPSLRPIRTRTVTIPLRARPLYRNIGMPPA
jgi:hypothetical protein